MKKFGIDNPFFGFMSRVGDILLLNILFVMTCLPVVTVGMSLSAMYRVTLRMARKESNYVAREYFRACKEEWKKSTVIWIILFAAGALLMFDMMMGDRMWDALNIAVGAVFLVWGMVFTYIFPVSARFENTVKNTFKNAAYMAVRHFPSTVVMLALNAIPLVCILFGSMATALAAPIYVTFGFALTARINSVLFDRIFRKYIVSDTAGDGAGDEYTDRDEKGDAENVDRAGA